MTCEMRGDRIGKRIEAEDKAEAEGNMDTLAKPCSQQKSSGQRKSKETFKEDLE
ncbi:MAG: hypothetical protein ACYC27_06200 [Armatimonadota bacterium]